MQIPKRFKLFGNTIEVLRKNADATEARDRVGFASYRLNEIHISPSTENMPLKQDQVEQAFCHELTHFLFFNADLKNGDESLTRDEEAVDRVSKLLHQALTTMEYE
jgi:hypothetical protein